MIYAPWRCPCQRWKLPCHAAAALPDQHDLPTPAFNERRLRQRRRIDGIATGDDGARSDIMSSGTQETRQAMTAGCQPAHSLTKASSRRAIAEALLPALRSMAPCADALLPRSEASVATCRPVTGADQGFTGRAS